MRRTRVRTAITAGVTGVLAIAALVLAGPVAASVDAPSREASAVSAVSADVNDFTFDSFDTDYTLTRVDDGTSRMRVVETIVAVFPDSDQNKGIRRTMPDSYNGQPAHVNLISVTDENGAERPSETDSDDGTFEIVSRADHFLHGRQTYVITYTLENVTWDFPDTGLEFYRDVNGVDWPQPFGSVTARLHLDADLAGKLSGRMACYQGNQDATDACASIERGDAPGGGAIITAQADGLGPHQTLTMAVGFAPGTFTMFDSSYFASPWGWLQAVAGVGVLGAGALAIRSRRRGLADEPGRQTIIAEYDPPAHVDALQSAVLLGRTPKAIPAEVLEQAVVGSIRILDGKPSWTGKKHMIAELVDPSLADGDGQMLLAGLFPEGEVGSQYEFGRQDTRFSSVAQKILTAADKDLTQRGFRRSVKTGTRLWPILLAAVGLALAFVFGMTAAGAGTNGLVPILVIVGAFVVAAVAIGLVSRRPLTALGAETRDHLRGLEEFIGWAEADRIRMLQSPSGAERVPVDANDPRQKLALYEKLLPYAVVFGQEKQWSTELSVLYTAVGASGPYWYVGTGTFDASSFASTVATLSSAASSSSSTSGGSSGGGSAGGGGGGGGGGGV